MIKGVSSLSAGQIKPQPDTETCTAIRDAIHSAKGTDDDVRDALHQYALEARKHGAEAGEAAALRHFFLMEGLTAPGGQNAAVLQAVEAAYRSSYPRSSVVDRACSREPRRRCRNALSQLATAG